MVYEQKLSALVVDDEPDVVEFVTDVLQSANCDVWFAVDGNQALKRAEANHLDIVFLDINIPEQDGWLVCSKLKMSSSPPMIVLMTGRTESDTDRFAEFVNADQVLKKPFFEEDVLRVLSQANSAVLSD